MKRDKWKSKCEKHQTQVVTHLAVREHSPLLSSQPNLKVEWSFFADKFEEKKKFLITHFNHLFCTGLDNVELIDRILTLYSPKFQDLIQLI